MTAIAGEQITRLRIVEVSLIIANIASQDDHIDLEYELQAHHRSRQAPRSRSRAREHGHRAIYDERDRADGRLCRRCGCGSRIEHRHPVGQSAVARAVHRRVHQAKWQLDGAISTGNRDLAISLSRSASPKTNRCVGWNRASTLKYHYCITSQLLAARGLEADRKYQAAIAATMEDANSI